MLINICICTYKRPELLRACLGSLQKMQQPELTQLTVTVVDNDVEGSAQDVVESFKKTVRCKVVYQIEPRRGIPCARNRALDLSLEMLADSIVFIDDDETVRSDWFVELIKASEVYGRNSVVHGCVVSKLNDDVSPSISGLFNKKTRKEGQQLSACATDNVLIPMSFVRAHKLRFDESKPLAGGTDTIFFTQASQLGVKIYQTNRAVVDETVPNSRSTLKWLIRRKFRAGLTEAWRKRQKGRSRASLIFSAGVQFSISFLEVVFFMVVFNPLERNKNLLKLGKFAGVLMGCFNVKIDSYKVIDS